LFFRDLEVQGEAELREDVAARKGVCLESGGFGGAEAADFTAKTPEFGEPEVEAAAEIEGTAGFGAVHLYDLAVDAGAEALFFVSDSSAAGGVDCQAGSEVEVVAEARCDEDDATGTADDTVTEFAVRTSDELDGQL
jgi:hypothetical protein